MSCDHCNKEFPEYFCARCEDAIYCGIECFETHECIGRKSSTTLSQSPKFHKVMREFKQGTLKSSSGKKVTSRDQALAIAFSEARRSRRKKKKR